MLADCEAVDRHTKHRQEEWEEEVKNEIQKYLFSQFVQNSCHQRKKLLSKTPSSLPSAAVSAGDLRKAFAGFSMGEHPLSLRDRVLGLFCCGEFEAEVVLCGACVLSVTTGAEAGPVCSSCCSCSWICPISACNLSMLEAYSWLQGIRCNC